MIETGIARNARRPEGTSDPTSLIGISTPKLERVKGQTQSAFGFVADSWPGQALGSPGLPPSANCNFGLAPAGLAGRVVEFQARLTF